MKNPSIILFLFIFFISSILIFNNSKINSNKFKNPNLNYHYSEDFQFNWPLKNKPIISSKFGPRIHPISKKESFHNGIDIPAKENTKIFSLSDGIITFADFLGANGYSIIIKNENFEFTYSHVSPNFILKINDKVKKGQHISNVGPLYLTTKTPYRSKNGYFLNGLSTRYSSSFINKKRW